MINESHACIKVFFPPGQPEALVYILLLSVEYPGFNFTRKSPLPTALLWYAADSLDSLDGETIEEVQQIYIPLHPVPVTTLVL